MTTYALDLTPAEAVANGAQLLDERLPGWWREITLDKLNLADCEHCVCGQLARNAAVTMEINHYRDILDTSYGKTLRFLNLHWQFSSSCEDGWESDYHYGFNIKSRMDLGNVTTEAEYEMLADITYLLLETEWRTVIKARLEADALQVPDTRVIEPARLPELVC